MASAQNGITEGGANVLLPKIGIEPENLRKGDAGSRQTREGPHRHAHAAQARLPSHPGGIDGDALQAREVPLGNLNPAQDMSSRRRLKA